MVGLAAAASLWLLLAEPVGSSPTPARPPDPRSQVILREVCTSSLDRRDLTLFANGTVRLRQGRLGAERMVLHELGPREMKAYLGRIDSIDLSETESPPDSPEGEWTSHCHLDLNPPGHPGSGYDYDRYSVGGLALQRIRRIVGDLLEEASQEVPSAAIPAAYRPAIGDRLERDDGVVFEVVGFTADGKGVELTSLREPLTMYVERAKLREVFRRLVASPGTP